MARRIKTEETDIKPTCDRKTKFWSRQYNTYGLTPGKTGSCPGCTEASGGCWHLAAGRTVRTCYVDSLRRCYSGVSKILDHNFQLLRGCGNDVRKMADILDREFTRFETAELKHAAKAGTKPDLKYRIHWSGDLFSSYYAAAIAVAVKRHPNVQFWTYTRSFEYFEPLLNCKNLNTYLSLDPVNKEAGLAAYRRCKGGVRKNLNLCYMGRDQHECLEFRTSRCPVDAGNMELEYGCSRCKMCFTPRTNPVFFRT